MNKVNSSIQKDFQLIIAFSEIKLNFTTMKKIILALLLIPFTNQLKAQTELINIDFQSGIPTDFTLVDNDGNTPYSSLSEFTGAWINYDDPDSLTNNVAASTSYFTVADSADRWLITPALQLGAFGNFVSWKAKSHDPSFPDDYMVLLSTTGTNIADFIDTLGNIEEENFEWTKREVNLSTKGYNSQQVFIAIVIRSLEGFKLYVDDIIVRKDDPLTIIEKEQLNFNLYPNPFQNVLTIQTEEEISLVRLFDLKGRVLIEKNTTTLNLEHLEKGYYFIQITSGTKIATRKVLKL